MVGPLGVCLGDLPGAYMTHVIDIFAMCAGTFDYDRSYVHGYGDGLGYGYRRGNGYGHGRSSGASYGGGSGCGLGHGTGRRSGDGSGIGWGTQ